MNFKIGIIWVLIVTTVAGTGTVIYNNFKVKDAHNLVGALGANVISSFGFGSSSSNSTNYKGYEDILCTAEHPNAFGNKKTYNDKVPLAQIKEEIKKLIQDKIDILGDDPLVGRLSKLKGKIDALVDYKFNILMCECLHPDAVKSEFGTLVSAIDMLDVPSYLNSTWAQRKLFRMKFDSFLDPIFDFKGDMSAKGCERSEKQVAEQITIIEPKTKTSIIVPIPREDIVLPVTNQSKQQIVTPEQNNETTNQSDSVKLSNPITAPKPLVPTNTFQQTAPLVGPVQSPTTPTAIAPIPVPQKLSSSQICSAVGWPTVNACGGYTAYASRQSNPAYTYKGVTYSMSYTLHKNTAGAVCRDLCVGTAKN